MTFVCLNFFHHWPCKALAWKMEGLSENENQGMQNEKIVLFINEMKIEEKVQGI